MAEPATARVPRAPEARRVPPSGPPSPATWRLFAALAVLMLLFTWYSQEYVMTREVHEALLLGSLDLEGIERYWEAYRRWRLGSLVLTPVILWVTLAFVALTLQMFLLLGDVNVRFSRLFRVAVIAQGIWIVKSAVQLRRWAGLAPEEITPETWYRPVGQLAGLVPWRASEVFFVGDVLGVTTLFEIAWYAALFVGLVVGCRLARRRAAAVLLAMCVAYNTFEWALNAFVERLDV